MSAGSNFGDGERDDRLAVDPLDEGERAVIVPPSLADYDAEEYLRRLRAAEGKLPRSGDA